ncbi:MAG: heme-binding protein, partial [Desulfobacterales bacterium]
MKAQRLLAQIRQFALIAILLIFAAEAVAIEKAKYQVVESDKNFELRQYAPRIVAETFVAGDFEAVGDVGFRRLYEYISGNNIKNQNIAMTAPVTQEARSGKIAMTAPVTQEKSQGQWRITFLMPAEYTMETLPRPLDELVQLKEEPGYLMATIRYSGT